MKKFLDYPNVSQGPCKRGIEGSGAGFIAGKGKERALLHSLHEENSLLNLGLLTSEPYDKEFVLLKVAKFMPFVTAATGSSYRLYLER